MIFSRYSVDVLKAISEVLSPRLGMNSLPALTAIEHSPIGDKRRRFLGIHLLFAWSKAPESRFFVTWHFPTCLV